MSVYWSHSPHWSGAASCRPCLCLRWSLAA